MNYLFQILLRDSPVFWGGSAGVLLHNTITEYIGHVVLLEEGCGEVTLFYCYRTQQPLLVRFL